MGHQCWLLRKPTIFCIVIVVVIDSMIDFHKVSAEMRTDAGLFIVVCVLPK